MEKNKKADNFIMDITGLFNLTIQVFKDWRVWVGTAVFFTFIGTGNYIVRYTKKPPRIRVKPKPAAAEAKPAETAKPAEAAPKE